MFKYPPKNQKAWDKDSDDIAYWTYDKFKILNGGEYSDHLNIINIKQIYKIINDFFLPGKKIIDIGGGNGEQRLFFADYDYSIMDIRDRNIHNDVTCVVGDITSCPHIQSNSYDVVFSKDVLEHVRNPFAAASEMVRITKKGGMIICITPFSWRYHPSPEDYWRFTHKGLEEIFTNYSVELVMSGYDIVRRRKNYVGGNMKRGEWKPSLNTPPIDELGGWRENWHAIFVGNKIT